MRFAVIPLIISAILHVLGFALAGFAYESVFLIFPAMLYCLLSVFLLRGNNGVAWLLSQVIALAVSNGLINL